VGPPAGTWPRARGRQWAFEGSGDSLATLHGRYRSRLEAVAFRILGNQADAEDVVQRIFVRLPHARFRGQARLGTYLYRAAVNGSVNVLRARRRRERLQRELVLEGARVEPARLPSPEGQVLEGEILAGVARALLRVKPQHRRVLVMRIVWGLSNVEIARREEVPVATVGTWLRRGRAELAQEIGPMLAELEEDRR